MFPVICDNRFFVHIPIFTPMVFFINKTGSSKSVVGTQELELSGIRFVTENPPFPFIIT